MTTTPCPICAATTEPVTTYTDTTAKHVCAECGRRVEEVVLVISTQTELATYAAP